MPLLVLHNASALFELDYTIVEIGIHATKTLLGHFLRSSSNTGVFPILIALWFIPSLIPHPSIIQRMIGFIAISVLSIVSLYDMGDLKGSVVLYKSAQVSYHEP